MKDASKNNKRQRTACGLVFFGPDGLPLLLAPQKCHTGNWPQKSGTSAIVPPTKQNAPPRTQRNDAVSGRETSVPGIRCGADRLAVPSFHTQL